MTLPIHSTVDYILKVMLIVGLTFGLLYVGNSIIMPILFSGLLTILLLPLTRFFERFRWIHRGVASFFTVLIATCVFIGILFLVALQMNQVISSFPEKKTKSAEKMIRQPAETISEKFGIKNYTVAKLMRQSGEKFKSGFIDLLKSALIGLREAVLFFIVCPIYLFFMLLYRSNIYAFYIEFFSKKTFNVGQEILHEIQEILQAYLKGLFFVVLIVAALTTIGLLALGLKYAVFIGLLSGLLTLIPFVGVIVSALIPAVLAYATKDSMWYVAGVAGIYALVQFLEGNFITPNIMGNKVNVNPLIILITIVIMGAVSGIVGIILTVPILATLKVIVDHCPHLTPWKHLLEDKLTLER